MKTVLIEQTLVLSTEVEVTDEEFALLKAYELTPEQKEIRDIIQGKLCRIADEHRRDRKLEAEWSNTSFHDAENEGDELFDVG